MCFHSRMPVTAAEFRRLALSFRDTVEGSHMGHADFRVGGKIFATLPFEGHGMVKLSAADQAHLVDPETESFMPAAGAWGRQGSTFVKLKLVSKDVVKDALQKAWQNTAPKAKTPRAKSRA
jgi:hypothetical protein